MPRGVRRNPFQALLDTANKQLQFARERLAAAEEHSNCIHQKKLRAARHEHDEWSKMVKSLTTSLTIPKSMLTEPPPAENPPILPDPLLEQPLQSPAPASKKQSNNDAEARAMRDNPLSVHYQPNVGDVGNSHGPNGQPDAGDRQAKRGPQLTGKKPGRPARVDHFDKCPGLVNLKCTNSKPFENELCGRCATMRSIPPILRPTRA